MTADTLDRALGVTEIDVTRALDAFYPNECWDVTLGDDLPAIRAKMRAALEEFARSRAAS